MVTVCVEETNRVLIFMPDTVERILVVLACFRLGLPVGVLVRLRPLDCHRVMNEDMQMSYSTVCLLSTHSYMKMPNNLAECKTF